jgi:hypothetical protein
MFVSYPPLQREGVAEVLQLLEKTATARFRIGERR